MRRLREGEGVWVPDDCGGFEFGAVTQVNEPDQGDFEYFVETPAFGSFWPREDIKLRRPSSLPPHPYEPNAPVLR